MYALHIHYIIGRVTETLKQFYNTTSYNIIIDTNAPKNYLTHKARVPATSGLSVAPEDLCCVGAPGPGRNSGEFLSSV